MTNQKKIEASNDGCFGVADVACATSNGVAGATNQESVFIKALGKVTVHGVGKGYRRK